jgi:hypothetical protein
MESNPEAYQVLIAQTRVTLRVIPNLKAEVILEATKTSLGIIK